MHNAIDRNGFRYLHIEPRHTAALTVLPYHHKDPFDRLLIAQAMVEGIPILSADAAFDPYPITRFW
jgi:PIN domain nuclease of toxin-antitoxin system